MTTPTRCRSCGKPVRLRADDTAVSWFKPTSTGYRLVESGED